MKKARLTVRLTAAMLTLSLLTIPAIAADPPASAVRVNSYKGNTLAVGERSGLMIGPSGTEYTVTSSNPDTVLVEQITACGGPGATGGQPHTTPAPPRPGARKPHPHRGGRVTPAAPTARASGDSASQTEEPDVRQELVRLINQTRKANGVAELPVSEALMTAAQTLSDQRYTWHHTKEECEAVIASGYPYGFGINLTVFTGVATEDAAQHAHDNWLKSPGHFETMIKPDCDSIGVGMTESGGVTYCFMIVGRPNTHNPYEP